MSEQVYPNLGEQLPVVHGAITAAEADQLLNAESAASPEAQAVYSQLGANAVEGFGYALVTETGDDGETIASHYINLDPTDLGTKVKSETEQALGFNDKEHQLALIKQATATEAVGAIAEKPAMSEFAKEEIMDELRKAHTYVDQAEDFIEQKSRLTTAFANEFPYYKQALARLQSQIENIGQFDAMQAQSDLRLIEQYGHEAESLIRKSTDSDEEILNYAAKARLNGEMASEDLGRTLQDDSSEAGDQAKKDSAEAATALYTLSSTLATYNQNSAMPNRHVITDSAEFVVQYVRKLMYEGPMYQQTAGQMVYEAMAIMAKVETALEDEVTQQPNIRLLVASAKNTLTKVNNSELFQ